MRNFELGPEKFMGVYEIDYDRLVVLLSETHYIIYKGRELDGDIIRMSSQELWAEIGEEVEYVKSLLCP